MHHELERIDARLTRIERYLRVLLRAASMEMDRDAISIHNQEIIMATKEEVSADIAEIKAEVAGTRGAADSAITLLREVLDRVGTAAASATDLDGFRAELALIKSETVATESALKAAVVQTP